MKYLLDTNVCIGLINGTSSRILHQLTSRGIGQVGLSSITVGELAFGVLKSRSARNVAALQTFLIPFAIAVFDQHAAWRTGEVRAALERRGRLIGELDTQIAGHALALRTTVVTHNVGEFSRVPGLNVEDWT